MENESNMNVTPQHRAGFVNIVGNPNVGKSTLSNRLVGERLSIITSKSQTTRHRIMGIVNGDDYQIVFSDTPGVLKPKFKLQESMLEYSTGALVDADVLIYVTDVVETPTKNQDFLDKVAKEKIPILLVINKIDLLHGNDDLLEIIGKWKELLPQAEVFPTSATENFNVDNLMSRIIELLPVSPPYFGKDALTDRSSRFFVTEIVREKILMTYDKEVPYATQVIVELFDEKDDSIHIMAVIYVERDSQKGIIIGHQGKKLKHVGIESRKELEKFFGKKVFLQLYVKVEKDWRNQENKLRSFGYID
ncbi:MAG: GTPase Era [Bacteroidales bacterium]|nr:GTPase Era [Candidatus Sodaliphilus aphodohippi]